MCGIAGLIDSRLSGDQLANNAARMAAALVHRGPDDQGVWSDEAGAVGLGHRRLSIIDLSQRGHQPMLSASGRYVICYNGELYNFRELRRELEAAGTGFDGDSDTEVLLAAIERWSLDKALQRLIGMFAFALWDRQRHELHLVRDRLGIKPLYWGRFGDLFMFGSELKALRECPGWTPRIDRDALAAYMRWNYVPSPHSIYQDVAKLAPGHRLSVRSGAEPCIVRWWDVRAVTRAAAAARPELSDDEAVDLLEKRLGEAVRCRMISDVPLGAFLSGGIDSSAVAALMQANSSRPVRTFTIGFDEQGYNEAQFAREVSSHLGTDHTELIVRPQDALDAIPKLPEIYDEPFADSSQIPTFLVSQMTRRDVTVALSGDGGDELFAGYTRYDWADMVWRRFGGMALPLRQGLASLIRTVPSPIWRLANAMLAPPHRQDLVRERAFKLAAFISERNADAVYRLQHSHWQQPDRAVPGGFEPRGITWDEGLAGEFPDFVERMQIMDTLSYLPDDILTKVDRASMAVSLETRVPLLDHRVVELAWTLGPRHKRRRGQNKWILRQLLRRHLPAGFFDRPKKGFSVPIAAWLRGALRDWAEDLLSLRNLQDGEILNGPLVRQTWEAFLRGEEPAQEAIWGVLMFCAWRGRQGLLS